MQARIIRLKDNELSCRIAKDSYNQAKQFNLEPSYFDAISGSDALVHYQKNNIQADGKFKKGRPGVLGCFFSHWYLWNECLKQGPMVILEHDGYMIRSLPDNILDQFDDVLKLDRHDPYKVEYNSLIKNEENLEVHVEPYVNPYPRKVSTGNYFKGSYSYILKPSGAKKLIQWIQQRGHRPSDQQIGNLVLNTWTTVPTVARLHPFYSEGDNIKTQSLTANPT